MRRVPRTGCRAVSRPFCPRKLDGAGQSALPFNHGGRSEATAPKLYCRNIRSQLETFCGGDFEGDLRQKAIIPYLYLDSLIAPLSFASHGARSCGIALYQDIKNIFGESFRKTEIVFLVQQNFTLQDLKKYSKRVIPESEPDNGQSWSNRRGEYGKNAGGGA